jgi:23S rRNA (uracil1939-C5)-methyltransferase
MKEFISNLKIEKLVYQGYGLGFADSNPVFVLNAVSGDVVDVQIEYNKGKSKFATIKNIIQKSPLRVESDCEVFGNCGGCDWLNLSYEAQLKAKNEIVGEIFRNVSIKNIKSIISSNKQFNYRNKSFFPISEKGGEPLVGMFAKKSHDVVMHKQCRLQPAIFDEIIAEFISYLKASHVPIYNEKTGKGSARHLGIRYSESTGEMLIVFVTKTRKIPFTNQLVRIITEKFPQIVGIVQNINPGRTNVILGDDEKLLFGRDHIFEEIGGVRFKLNYKSFFQVNTKIAESMYDFVKSNLSKSKNVLDAYCGVGSIGIYVSDGVENVIGIENNKNAVSDAKENAGLNKQDNCIFLTGNVENILPQLKENIDTIIFDPPRKGLDAKIISAIPVETKKIVYISCDPTTQQRDVVRLLEIGFSAKIMQPFDMFPNTFHIENVIVLDR